MFFTIKRIRFRFFFLKVTNIDTKKASITNQLTKRACFLLFQAKGIMFNFYEGHGQFGPPINSFVTLIKFCSEKNSEIKNPTTPKISLSSILSFGCNPTLILRLTRLFAIFLRISFSFCKISGIVFSRILWKKILFIILKSLTFFRFVFRYQAAEYNFPHCPEEKSVKTFIEWGVAYSGAVQIRPCPRGSVGTAYRKCSQNQLWLDEDLSGCVVSVIAVSIFWSFKPGKIRLLWLMKWITENTAQKNIREWVFQQKISS